MTNLDIKVKAKGRCRVQLLDAVTGSVTFDSGEFDNTLLNTFFSQAEMYFQSGGTRCYACTDSVVNVTDTTMASLGYTATVSFTNLSPVYAGSMVTVSATQTFVFNAGAIVGNLSCIAIANSSPAYTTPLIKTLIKDVNGDPTSISVGISDQLIITHTLKYTIDSDPAPINTVVDGTSHAFQFVVARINNPGSGNIVATPFMPFVIATSGIGDRNPSAVLVANAATTPAVTVGTGQIALTNAVQLTGAYTTNVSTSAGGYSTATVTASMPANVNLTATAGIGFIGVGTAISNCFSGIEITPPLPKDTNIAYTFTITFTLSR